MLSCGLTAILRFFGLRLRMGRPTIEDTPPAEGLPFGPGCWRTMIAARSTNHNKGHHAKHRPAGAVGAKSGAVPRPPDGDHPAHLGGPESRLGSRRPGARRSTLHPTPGALTQARSN